MFICGDITLLPIARLLIHDGVAYHVHPNSVRYFDHVQFFVKFGLVVEMRSVSVEPGEVRFDAMLLRGGVSDARMTFAWGVLHHHDERIRVTRISVVSVVIAQRRCRRWLKARADLLLLFMLGTQSGSPLCLLSADIGACIGMITRYGR